MDSRGHQGASFAAGAIAGAALTAALGACYCYYSTSSSSSKNSKLSNLHSHHQQPQQQQHNQQHQQHHHASLQQFDQDEVLAEQLTRNVQFFGLDKQKQITNSFVVVIGLGVSSSWCGDAHV